MKTANRPKTPLWKKSMPHCWAKMDGEVNNNAL